MRVARRLGAEPMDVAAADQRDGGAGLGEQRGGFAGALAAADHRDVLAAEDAEVGMVGGVADDVDRQAAERGRPDFLVGEAHRDDDAARAACWRRPRA